MKICVASVLKPVQDARMYTKIALGLHSFLPKAMFYLVGFKGIEQKNSPEDFFFYPIFYFKRLHLRRFLANITFLRKLISIKPDAIVCSTFELLPASIAYKSLKWVFRRKKVKIIYDVTENYAYNILYTDTFVVWLRRLLAYFVVVIEKISIHFIDYVIFAEKCYENEITYLATKKIPFVVLENKLYSQESTQGLSEIIQKRKDIQGKIQRNESINFILTGTISSEYGIFDAIDFIGKVQKVYPEARLTLIGCCMLVSEFEQIKESIKALRFVKNNISFLQQVPHDTIMAEMQAADVALLPYKVQKAYQNRIPTKFYEYLYAGLPMIISENIFWDDFFTKFDFRSHLSVDFGSENAVNQVLEGLCHTKFYENELVPKEIFWALEKQKLKPIAEALTNISF